jgi:hypothetical protein
MKFYHSKQLSSFNQLAHAFTTTSSGNLAFHVGDSKPTVLQNHSKLAFDFGYNQARLTYMNQIHSNKVVTITQENINSTPSCDALITNLTNAPLMVMVADCSPVLLFDAKQGVIAAIHAGRAGAFSNIIKESIESMSNSFDSKAKDLVATIGASIGVCCYEVGKEIEDEAKILSLEYALKHRDGRRYLDVNAILKQQLLSCGVVEENIEFANICSSCNTDTYYSYRASGQTGRFAGVIMLKDTPIK